MRTSYYRKTHLKWPLVCAALYSLTPVTGQVQQTTDPFVTVKQVLMPQRQSQSLLSIIHELKGRYKVSFLYQKKNLEGKYYYGEVRYDQPLDVLLEEVLKPNKLQFEKVKSGTYTIFSSEKKKSSETGKSEEQSLINLGTEPTSAPHPNGLASLEQSIAEVNAITIKGRVTDDKGEGMPGVTVLEKGTTNGTTTNANGEYTLSIAGQNSILVFSFVGYVPEEVAVGNQAQVNVTLLPDIKSLNEVVVIGYGSREKKDVTSAISNIDSKEISKSVSITPELAMQGKMTGVFVSTPGGNPNARPLVRIRGVGTTNNADPLYVIDGVPVTEFGGGLDGVQNSRQADIRGGVNVLSLINPNDIESISVLKDAAAAAIYGVRAANGVILITTKKGKTGRPRIEFNASTGIQNAIGKYDVLNTQQYTQLWQEAWQNGLDNGVAKQKDYPAVLDPNSTKYLGNQPTYDWQDARSRQAAMSDISVRVAGGSEATTYYVSGGYSKQSSPFIGNDVERYSFATNINSKVSKYLNMGFTYRGIYSKALDESFQGGDFALASTNAPWQPIYDSNGPRGFATVQELNDKGEIAGPRWGNGTRSNSLAMMDYSDTNYDIYRNIGSAFVELEPLKGLKFRGTLSGDWYYNWRRGFSDYNNYLFSQTPSLPSSFADNTSEGRFDEVHNRNQNLVKEFGINFNRSFGQHNLDVLLNASEQKYKTDITFAGTKQLSNIDYPNLRFLQAASDPKYNDIASYPENLVALQGYLARVSYNYNSKYYLDVVVRRDGSSRFAPEYRWGTFPGISAAWRISAESFMQNLSMISDLKLRGGYGKLGNQEIGLETFPYLPRVITTSDIAFGSGNGNAQGNIYKGAAATFFAAKDISWETSSTANIALDGGLLNNRITFTVEYYNRYTKDILQAVPLPASSGAQNTPFLNVAAVRNSGMEFQLGYNQQFGDITFNASGNLTTVKNRVVALYKDQPTGGQTNRIQEGYPIGYLWGYEVGGIFQSQEEIDAWIASAPDGDADQSVDEKLVRPGDMYFQDVAGKPLTPGGQPDPSPDGRVTADDRVYLGKTIPGYYYGLNLGAGWKGFDLSVAFQGVGDVQRYNRARESGEYMTSTNIPNQWTTTLNRWTPENASTSMPRAVINDPAGNTRFSSRWIENAGFFRLKNVQLGYNLPKNLLGKTGFIENVRLYVSGTNLLTITKWSGIDPEEQDRDGSVFPPTRIFTFGINAGF